MTYSILGDMHTHTIYSRHAYSTIQENVAAAATAGLELLGSADHFSSMLHPEQDLRNFQYFINTEVWPREWMGVTLLSACEADIVDLGGGLFGQDIAVPQSIVGRPFKAERSLYERVTCSLDYVVASVHNTAFTEGATLGRTTDMYVRALEHPEVFILGHLGRSGVDFDLDAVLMRAKELHKLIEINEHSFERGSALDAPAAPCRRIAERCAELGVGISVDSDAHIAPEIGRYPRTTKMLEEIDFPEELIVNRGRDPFVAGLAAAGIELQSRLTERA